MNITTNHIVNQKLTHLRRVVTIVTEKRQTKFSNWHQSKSNTYKSDFFLNSRNKGDHYLPLRQTLTLPFSPFYNTAYHDQNEN